eukprot:TRINITY_DN24026_c0_g1_i5.p2 TRINITY_DN24026_c0_g1~~TRINITY_DN24026_c0_g1_i5.p2  ORF type:complete len:141 (-),score=21.68 TRINITY_DN24026_c0_g1_i5:153-575(-)
MSFKGLVYCVMALIAAINTGVLAGYPEEYKDYEYYDKYDPYEKFDYYYDPYDKFDYYYDPYPYEKPNYYQKQKKKPDYNYSPVPSRQAKKVGFEELKANIYPRPGSISSERMQKYMGQDGKERANRYCIRILGYPCYTFH